jgi:hypothetical protein
MEMEYVGYAAVIAVSLDIGLLEVLGQSWDGLKHEIISHRLEFQLLIL